MLFGGEAADAALEKVVVARIEEGRQALVVAAGDVAEEEILAVVVEDYLHGFGVIVVVGLALQAQRHPDAQPVPNEVRFVIFAARQVAVQIEFAFLFHNLVVFNHAAKLQPDCAKKRASGKFILNKTSS